jgi:hypothetical protein
MANNLTVTKNYTENGLVSSITESTQDDFVNSIETFINTTKLTSDNLATDAVISANIQTGAITTAKIADGAITTAKLADTVVDTGDVADDAITSAEQAVPTVPNTDGTDPGVDEISKLEAGDSGSVTVPASPDWVTFATISLTNTGRLIHISMPGAVDKDTADPLSITSTTGMSYRVVRNDLTTILASTATLSEVADFLLSHTDSGTSTAGTYTYKIQGQHSTGGVSRTLSYGDIWMWEI